MKVLVVDDDRLVSGSLKTILEADEEIRVVGTLNSGAQAVEQYGKLNPDVLLMDIRMEGITGLDAAQAILKEHPDAKILFLTTFVDCTLHRMSPGISFDGSAGDTSRIQ